MNVRRALILVLVPAVTATAADAQTASQITPPDFAPRPAAPDRAVVIVPETPARAGPRGADRIALTLADVVVDGDTSPALIAALRERLVDQPVTLADVFDAAGALEQNYAKAGAILTRVVVPAQSLQPNGTLRLVVVRGFIERIDAAGVDRRIRRHVEARLADLQGRPDITLAEIERRLLTAGAVPGARLRSTFGAGAASGASVLRVEADWRPITGFASLDNSLSDALGRRAFALGLNANGVLGLGESVYARISGVPMLGPNGVLAASPRNRTVAGGVILPLGHDGLTVNIEAVEARTRPRNLMGFPSFASHFRRVSTRLDYPVVRRRLATLTARVAFDAQSEQLGVVEPVVLPLSLDRLRVLSAGATLAASLGGGFVTVSTTLYTGLDALGARGDAAGELPPSRAGARPSFQRLEASVSLDQPLGASFAFAARASAQTSFGQAMANSQQFGIASADGISALPAGSVLGDAGFVGRAELRAPHVVGVAGRQLQLSPYGFGAYGEVRIAQPSAVERPRTHAHAVGVGIRLASADTDSGRGLSLAFEYARGRVSGLPGAVDRINIASAIQF